MDHKYVFSFFKENAQLFLKQLATVVVTNVTQTREISRFVRDYVQLQTDIHLWVSMISGQYMLD